MESIFRFSIALKQIPKVDALSSYFQISVPFFDTERQTKDGLKRKGEVVEMRMVPLFPTEELLERILSDGSVISGLRYYVLITMAVTKGKKG